jgi:hypothetical protein
LKDNNAADVLILGGKELNNSVPEYLKVRFPRLNLLYVWGDEYHFSFYSSII